MLTISVIGLLHFEFILRNKDMLSATIKALQKIYSLLPCIAR
jgi:hypothetical protein